MYEYDIKIVKTGSLKTVDLVLVLSLSFPF